RVFAFDPRNPYILPSPNQGRNRMIQIHVNQKQRLTAGIVACWLGVAPRSWAAENRPTQAPPSSASSPTGKLLTIEDAVRIGLDNHPRIRSANERIGSQNAILGQQM